VPKDQGHSLRQAVQNMNSASVLQERPSSKRPKGIFNKKVLAGTRNSL